MGVNGRQPDPLKLKCKTYEFQFALLLGDRVSSFVRAATTEAVQCLHRCFGPGSITRSSGCRGQSTSPKTPPSSATTYSPRRWVGSDAKVRPHRDKTGKPALKDRLQISPEIVSQVRGRLLLDPGFEVDVENNDYRAHLVLVSDGGGRITAQLHNPFSRLLYDVDPVVNLRFEHDPASQTFCLVNKPLVFHLDEAANVAIKVLVNGVIHDLYEGVRDPSVNGSERFFIILDYTHIFPPEETPEGGYPFQIVAQSLKIAASWTISKGR